MRPLRQKLKRRQYTGGHVIQLSCGHDFFGDAFGRLDESKLEALREAWDELEAEAMARHIERFPGSRPMAWWLFSAPAKHRPKTIAAAMEFYQTTEAREILDRLGIISDAERDEIRRREALKGEVPHV